MRSRRGRAVFLFVLISGIAAFTATWYGSTGRSGGSTPAFGGGYVEGVIGAPARINPLFAGQNEADAALVALIFAGLTRLDDKGQPFPDLAETWVLSQDGRTYTFSLRQGLLWQDGAPLTADDVVFTYSLLKAPGLRAPPNQARALADATIAKVDSRTVSIELPQAYAPLPAYLTLGILPSHLLRTIQPGAMFDAAFNQQPMGAGPYRLDHLSPDRASLVANPAHHLGQPFIQRLDLRFYRDEGAMLEALKARQVNGAVFRSPLSQNDRVYLETRKDLRSTALVTGETAFVYFNLRQTMFQDRRLRQALLYALDREALIGEFLGGQALEPESPLAIDSWAYTDSLKRYGFDPSLANLLLDEAGWRRNEGGVRVRAGVALAFTLATNSDPLRVAIAQAMAKTWEAVGVRVTVEAGGTTTLVRDLLEPRNYQAALFSQVAEPDPDPYLAWHSSQGSGKGANLGSFSDDRVDKLLADARLNTPQARRKELYGQFQELFAQEVPALPVYTSSGIYVQSASIQGTRNRLITSPGDRFWQVQEWHLKTR
ncbi:MAG TPA: peptide ABC transporter substrate-binding protein [Dehalococcoidia bacterium]|nr:peptide ABC transporter substrate-binding protein [Dehalococcoidia bacterium]